MAQSLDDRRSAQVNQERAEIGKCGTDLHLWLGTDGNGGLTTQAASFGHVDWTCGVALGSKW